ncbi:leucine-rich receptor-like kinase family protein [Medicago truncatula]|uniref:Leucine-rich receptor-like kinase family protein n=1 Tax=Medicago truncatula TaxID=3880 RepID=A0A072U2C8_MEDTR|nr:leucine-rich receptor-like kinase family protein [Medicago truncatula]
MAALLDITSTEIIVSHEPFLDQHGICDISSIFKFNNSLLQALHLSYNNLSGNLPSCICHELPNLRMFYLDHNDISGNMPTVWNQCKELERLSLAFNSFNKGPMPGGIRSMTKLQRLFLMGNNLEVYAYKLDKRLNSLMMKVFRFCKICISEN